MIVLFLVHSTIIKECFLNIVIIESYFPDHIYLVTGFEVEVKKNHLNNPYVTV